MLISSSGRDRGACVYHLWAVRFGAAPLHRRVDSGWLHWCFFLFERSEFL